MPDSVTAAAFASICCGLNRYLFFIIHFTCGQDALNETARKAMIGLAGGIFIPAKFTQIMLDAPILL